MQDHKQFFSILALTIFLFGSQDAFSQNNKKNIFANPKNLKVLPVDISPDELRKTMLGFSAALNARCSYCHMVDDMLTMPDPDFSDDAKLTKKTARKMLKMVAEINGRISNIDSLSQQPRIEVTCITCHRGQYRPLLILPALTEARNEGGVDAVIAWYSELRERYYGNHTYDLRPSTLSGFARSMASEGDVDGAMKLLNFANESFPDEERVLFNLARVHQKKGNKDQAVIYLRRLVHLFPDSSFYAKQLNLAENEKIE